TSKEVRGSTQPATPRALIRLHVPRASPNWTCELGPIEAMTRDCMLALARTITHSLETEAVHRTARRAAVVERDGTMLDAAVALPAAAAAGTGTSEFDMACGTTVGADGAVSDAVIAVANAVSAARLVEGGLE